MDQLESELLYEESHLNELYDNKMSFVKRELVERTIQQHSKLDYVFNKFHNAIL